MLDVPRQEPAYTDRQAQHNREYADAWENAPQSFKDEAAQKGLAPEIPNEEGMAIDFNDNYRSSSYTPDMAELLDDFIDEIIEKFGSRNADLIRAIATELKKPMEEELARHRSLLLNRVACYLVSDEKGNLLARVHALLHSVPRLAAVNGFSSMRASARRCGVSPEWLRRKRDSWCDLLEIERPADGIKSEDAKLKYQTNALNNHWRNKKFKAA